MKNSSSSEALKNGKFQREFAISEEKKIIQVELSVVTVIFSYNA